MKYNLLDLFSGIGGFHKGLEEAGFEFDRVCFSEIDKHAIAVYQHNFKEAEYVGGIEKVSGHKLRKHKDEPWIVTGGSPCQDLSLAGKRKGLGGARSGLFTEMVRVISELQPDFFIWENVKGALSSNNGKDIEKVLELFGTLGYVIDMDIQNTRWFLPQNRERIYIVGVNLKWVGKRLLEVVNHGQQKMMLILPSIIRGYLLSKLHQNLDGLQRLQEVDSIGSVLNYVVTQKLVLNGQKTKSTYLKIISQWELEDYQNFFLDTQCVGLRRKDTKRVWFTESNLSIILEVIKSDTKDGIKIKKLYSCIEKLLKSLSDEESIHLKLCIISTMINRTTIYPTYTFAEIEDIIVIYIEIVRNLLPNLWQQELSILTTQLENMSNAETRRSENKANEENDNNELSFFDIEGFGYDSLGCLGGVGGREIFPIGEDGEFSSESFRQNAGKRERLQVRPSQAVNARQYKMGVDDTYIQVASNTSKGTQQGVVVRERVDTNYINNEDSKAINTITASNCSKNADNQPWVNTASRIRRLTPTECNRLQGFPDTWTDYGNYDGEVKEVSDTQKYKMAGNSVTTNVVKAIGEKLLTPLEKESSRDILGEEDV